MTFLSFHGSSPSSSKVKQRLAAEALSVKEERHRLDVIASKLESLSEGKEKLGLRAEGLREQHQQLQR